MTEKHEASSALTRQVAAGTMLFEEHDPGSRMYVIREGRVKIYRQSGDKEMVLAVLGPGDFFGEMALLESLPRSANAQAVESCELIEVDSQTFGQMLRSSPEIALRMMRKLASRVRELDLRLQNLLVDNGVGRSIETLRWLSSKGKLRDGYVRLESAAVHIAIAAQAGIPPHEAQRVYERLRDAGCIKEDGKDSLVADSETLDAFSHYLELKRRFDPTHLLSSSEAASQKDKSVALKRLLKTLQIDARDLDNHEATRSGEYSRYLELKRRFERTKGLQG